MNRTGEDAPGAAMPAPARVRRGAWVAVGACAGIAAVLLSVAAQRAPYFAADLAIARAVQSAQLGILAAPLHALNALGFPPLAAFAYGGVVAVVFAFGWRWEAAAGGFAALGGAGLNHLVKELVGRPRPHPQLLNVEHTIASPAFPAGHVLDFTAFVGFLCCLVYWRARPSWRRGSAIAVLVALMALMGVARVRSGEHWPSDVLGGYLFGVMWLAVTVWLYAWGRRRFPALRGQAPAAGARRGIAVALVLLGPAALATPAHAAPGGPDSLGATSEVPWNPPQAMARRLGWERAVLLPGRIVSLPLVGLGLATEYLFLRFEQDPRSARLRSSTQGSGRRGVAVGIPRIGDRTGLGGSVAVRSDLLHGALGNRVGLEYTATVRRYNRTILTWSGRPLWLQYGYEWRPQEQFYGIGNDTREDGESDYASQGEFVRAGMTWESNRKRDPSRPRSLASLWGGPRSQVTRTGRESGETSYEVRHPALGLATLDRRVENLAYGIMLLHDLRTGTPHRHHGWRALLAAERFDAPLHAFALHSGQGGDVRFTRYEAEAGACAAIMRDPRTVRLTLHVTDLQVGSDRDRLPLSDLSDLGGHTGLGGYPPGRFNDLDLLLASTEYIFPLVRRLEMNLHSEWGAVYPDVWNDAKFNSLHNSFGFALRVRDKSTPRASIGFDFSREGTRLRFAVGGLE